MATTTIPAASERDVPQSDEAPSSNLDANCLNILVVDDSDAIRDLMVEKLHQLIEAGDLSAQIDTARSGEEAIDRFEEKHHDLVLMDVEMPGMGGLSACKYLKDGGAPRVAMLSSLDSGEAHQAGHQAGCDNYLTKPPNDADIRVLLRLVSLRKQVLA